MPEEHRDAFFAGLRQLFGVVQTPQSWRARASSRSVDGGQGHSVDGDSLVRALEGVVAGTGPGARRRPTVRTLDSDALWSRQQRRQAVDLRLLRWSVGDNVARTARRDKKG